MNSISISRKLARYLGEEGNYGDASFVYRTKNSKGDFFRIKYSDNYGYYQVPNSRIEISRKVDNEMVLVSRFSPHLDIISPFQDSFVTLPYFGNLLVYLGGDLDPEHAIFALANLYYQNREKIDEEIENSSRFILERLIEDFPYVGSLSSLNQFHGSFLTSKDLKSLEEKLTDVDSSEQFTGIKMHKGQKLAIELMQKYETAKHEQRVKQEKEERERIRKQQLEEMAQITSVRREPTRSAYQGIGGCRRDIGFNFRSTWEANYARVLIFRGISFSYEPKSFELDVPEDMKIFFSGKEKVSYLPDFQIKDSNKFIEVKGGWFNYGGEEAMAKTILFRRQNPDLELEVIGIREDMNLEDQFKNKINECPMFCGWETGGRTQGHNLATSPEDFK